jgi:hypothetical protein
MGPKKKCFSTTPINSFNSVVHPAYVIFNNILIIIIIIIIIIIVI